MASESGLLSLPDELLVELISYCPLEDVLHLEATCIRICNLCKTRSTWINLVQNLDIDCAPDIPPQVSVESLSNAELRQKVKDAITRARSWKEPEKLRILYDLVLRIPYPENDPTVHSTARLLPGSRYLLLSNAGRLELWCLETLSCIWHAPPLLGRHQCTSFDFELDTDGRAITIVAEFITPQEMATYLRIFLYRFEHRSADLVYEVRLPYTNLFRLTIKNGICMAFLSSHFQNFLVDWKKGESLLLDFVDLRGNSINDSVRCLHIHNGHLLAAGRLSSGFSLIFFPLSDLYEHWSSDRDHSSWKTFQFVPESSGILNLSPPDDEASWMLTSHIFTPTWRKASPAEMYIVTYRGAWNSPTLLSFRIQLDSSEGYPLPRLRNAIRTPASRLPWDTHCISNSGQIFCLRNVLRCFSVSAEKQQPVAELDVDLQRYGDCEPSVTVEPWSGAVVAYIGRTVVIFRVE